MDTGAIITASVLVAAGIAVYQSPQFKHWLNNSRRKIALALHNVGDEIYPQNSRLSPGDDISMTEEVGEAAEERRRVAREEIMQRRTVLEERQRRNESQPLSSFDSIVDKDGTLKSGGMKKTPDASASSTAVDVSGPQLYHRGGKHNEPSTPVQGPAEYQHGLPETTEKSGHIDLPSNVSSNGPSSTLVDVTPTSEVPDAHAAPVHGKPEDVAQSGYFSVASGRSSSASEHTNNEVPELFYAHPDDASNASHADFQSPFESAQDYEQLSAPSAAEDVGHIHETNADASSDGTLSDLGRDSIATPNSWSEIGSVVSDDYYEHQ